MRSCRPRDDQCCDGSSMTSTSPAGAWTGCEPHQSSSIARDTPLLRTQPSRPSGTTNKGAPRSRRQALPRRVPAPAQDIGEALGVELAMVVLEPVGSVMRLGRVVVAVPGSGHGALASVRKREPLLQPFLHLLEAQAQHP